MTGAPQTPIPRPPPLERAVRETVTYDCEDCGAPVKRRRTVGEPRICVSCGIERGANAAREMANKAGPAYDRWLSTHGPKGRPAK